jgi:hypothetical protein
VNPQLRSELRKLQTTTTAAVMLLAALALTAFGVLVEGLSSTAKELAPEAEQRTLLGGGSVVVFFATLAGVLLVTAEFRYGTIRPTLLCEPRRRVVLGAKLAAAAVTAVVFAAVCLALSLGAGLAILAVRDVDVALTVADALALVVGTIAASAVGGALGVSLGALIRNQVGAIVALVAYAFVVDAGLFAAVPSLGRFLPGKAGDAVAGQSVEHLLTPARAAAVLAVWTLAFIVAATVRTDRTDV